MYSGESSANEEIGRSKCPCDLSEDLILFLDKTRHGMALVKDARIIYANPMIQEYTGYDLEELCEMDFWELTDEDHIQEVMEAAERIIRDPSKEEPITIPVFRKDGDQRILRVDGSIVEYGGESYILSSASNLT
jgi:PAS domain S-box-containing protein